MTVLPLEKEEMLRYIAKLLHTPEGREKVVASMYQPIVLRLDCTGLHRIFDVASTQLQSALAETEPGMWTKTFDFHDTVVTPLEHGRAMALIDRLNDKIRVECLRTINEAVVAFIDNLTDEATDLPIEPWPGGHLIGNAWSYGVLRGGALVGLEEECQRTVLQCGEHGTWEDMRIHVTRSAFRGRLLRIGKPEETATVWYTLSLAYDPTASDDNHFAVKVDLEGRIIPKFRAKVGVVNVRKSASIAH